jgi:hypothetical protein
MRQPASVHLHAMHAPADMHGHHDIAPTCFFEGPKVTAVFFKFLSYCTSSGRSHQVAVMKRLFSLSAVFNKRHTAHVLTFEGETPTIFFGERA